MKNIKIEFYWQNPKVPTVSSGEAWCSEDQIEDTIEVSKNKILELHTEAVFKPFQIFKHIATVKVEQDSK